MNFCTNLYVGALATSKADIKLDVIEIICRFFIKTKRNSLPCLGEFSFLVFRDQLPAKPS